MSVAVIDEVYLRETLAELLAIPSPTGFTDEIARRLCQFLDDLGVPYEMTRRGAIRARLAGAAPRPARAIVAHLDTLGAQVKRLKENGRLELVPIGHWSARFAEGARATVFGSSGAFRASILPLKASGHTFNDEVDTAPVGWQHVEARIDAHARTHADLDRLGIEIGDIVAIDPQPEFLPNGYIVSRHLDDKAGVAVMLTALKALTVSGQIPSVDLYFLFTIAEETGHGAGSILTPDIAALVAIDNGTSAPGQNSSEFGVTLCMADQTGPFDYHLTRKLARLCKSNGIQMQKDVFRYYRSDAAAAVEAGADVRTALATFGIDASHGYERIHSDALRSLAELIVSYGLSPVEIARDAEPFADVGGFTHQPVDAAPEARQPDLHPVPML